MRKPLKDQVLEFLGRPDYRPMDKVELSKKLHISSDDRSGLRAVLRDLEQAGQILRIRKDRYVLPEVADVVTGTIQIHTNGAAHILSERKGVPDVFVAPGNTGTAMNGDKVVAQLVHEGIRDRHRNLTDARQREGRVIRILERKRDTVVGTLERSKNLLHVVPDDPRLTRIIYVHDRGGRVAATPRIGDKVVVRLDPWENPSVNPEGEIIEVLGPASKPGVDMLVIIRKHHLPTEFPEPVLSEAENIPDRIDPRELERREDLRAERIITIDPDDARDFDDAIHVEQIAGGWRLGVHIADVSHYVHPRSALDREAYLRGNSVYLADRVIPMLPERLSNGICSLRPDEDRLTFSAFIDFTRGGKVKGARFSRTVIRSSARLTYKQAFAQLQVPPKDELSERLHRAWELASLLRKRRFEMGSLDLDFPEVKVRLDENGRPIALEKIENDISHQLIEEFMLAANEAVAFEIKRRLAPSIYRIHEDPDPDKLLEYRELALSFGFKVGDMSKRGEIQRFLASIRGKPEQYALKLGLLKSLKRAAYDINPIGHYGLAKTNYTHFTSPIRRYADLVVHRVLGQLIQGSATKKMRISAADLGAVAEHISTTERTAADAEKESTKLKKMEFFQTQIRKGKPQAFPAIIVDVRSYGMLVELPDFLVTGLIRVSTLPGDFYQFDSARLRFIGRRTRKTFQIGQGIPVLVSRVDMQKQQIDFVPADSY
jgi:ribonuclease R